MEYRENKNSEVSALHGKCKWAGNESYAVYDVYICTIYDPEDSEVSTMPVSDMSALHWSGPPKVGTPEDAYRQARSFYRSKKKEEI